MAHRRRRRRSDEYGRLGGTHRRWRRDSQRRCRSADVTATGTDGTDIAIGSATVADLMDGGAGNDALTGGDANDASIGGAGNDT